MVWGKHKVRRQSNKHATAATSPMLIQLVHKKACIYYITALNRF